MSRSEIMKTPTYERRYYLGLLRQENEPQINDVEETKTKDGRKIVTLSGDALKEHLKNPQNP